MRIKNTNITSIKSFKYHIVLRKRKSVHHLMTEQATIKTEECGRKE